MQGAVVGQNELLETEVGVVDQVVLQVGEGDLVAVQNQSLGGHQLHEPLTQVANQPLLEDSDHHAHLWVEVVLLVLRGAQSVETVHSFGDREDGPIVVQSWHQAVKLGVVEDQSKDVLRVLGELIQWVLHRK